MDDRVTERLASLRSEFQQGERQLAELDTQRAQLMETMLRISGAIQVLEELAGERPSSPPSAQPDDKRQAAA
jgi:prefoldin subunit 5